MIHTQYYALMRALAMALQNVSPNTTITQWDFNYNSKTFNYLKLHRNPRPFPKGIINISTIQKQFTYPLPQNASVGMNAADLVQFPNAFPIASAIDKFEIYGLTNRYNISADITIRFETAAQMLDFFHSYSEYFPGESKYFYDFEYDYYLNIPKEILGTFDPTTDNAINLFASMKDGASNFSLFSKCVSSPLIKCESINVNQSKESDSHSITLNFLIQDSFIYMIMNIDAKYWVRALSLNIIIKAADYGDSDTQVAEYGPETITEPSLPDFTSDADEDVLGNSQDNSEENNNNDTTVTDDNGDETTTIDSLDNPFVAKNLSNIEISPINVE